MKLSIRYLTLAAALAVGLPSGHAAGELISGLADDSAPPAKEKPSVDVVELTVHPAKPPRAALAHRLLPSSLDKTYGNAAPMYCKAILMARPEPEVWLKAEQWLATPPGNLPEDEVRRTVGSFDPAFEQLLIGSRRTYCDWGLPIWETDNPYLILLPELQESRNLARIVALRTQLAIAEGDLDKAVGSLQVGFTLARHVGEQPILVGGLVGTAIAHRMADQVERLVQLPDAPNLYWSLTDLPNPLVDLRGALEMESVAFSLLFPEFTVEKVQGYTPGQWDAVFDEKEIATKIALMLSLGPEEDTEKVLMLRERFDRAYPVAKRGLAALGHPKEKLDRMPASQVVVLYASLRFEELRDGLFKWLNLPYWQAREGVEAADEAIRDSIQQDSVSVAALAFPGIIQWWVASARLDRRVAALRSVEAIRFYAAVHGGKLPASLDDVTEVPLPVNPFTGKPFEYRLEGKTAVLEATGDGVEHSRPRQYRVTLAE
ncbi:MAG TPA: hypothetical protein VMY37_39930 [Thermoguttaceae bacterium]|nr:hypothetical protein [Thermoguttaceae bacterium]